MRHSLFVCIPLLVAACTSNEPAAPPSPASQPEQTIQKSVQAEGATTRLADLERYRSELQSRLDRKGGDLERHRVRENVTRVPLQRRFGHAVAARRGADGRLEYGCFGDAEETARFLTKTPREVQP